MVSINASHAAAAAHLPTGQAHGQRPSSASTTTATSTDPVDTVDLSTEGEAALESGVAPTGPGKSANSPAHIARSLAAESLTLDPGAPFGHLVRAIAQGNLESLIAPPPADEGTGDTGETTETGSGDEVPVVIDDPVGDDPVGDEAGDGAGDEIPIVIDDPLNDETGIGGEEDGGGTGGIVQDPELLAEATLIEELLDANEEEDEPLFT